MASDNFKEIETMELNKFTKLPTATIPYGPQK